MITAWVALAAAVLSPDLSRSAKQKLDRIYEGKVPPRSTILLSQDEINSFLRYDYAAQVPRGVTEPWIGLEPDLVQGSAAVDFAEWRTAGGAPPGKLLGWLLRGKRKVEAAGRFTSSGGNGRVDIESVKIGGMPISAAAVTFLIEHMVRPRYPAAVVGRSVPLAFHLEQARVERGRLVLRFR